MILHACIPWGIIWGSPCGIPRRFREVNSISFLIFGSSHESRSGLGTSFASLVARKSSQSAALVARTSYISAVIVSAMAIVPTANWWLHPGKQAVRLLTTDTGKIVYNGGRDHGFLQVKEEDGVEMVTLTFHFAGRIDPEAWTAHHGVRKGSNIVRFNLEKFLVGDGECNDVMLRDCQTFAWYHPSRPKSYLHLIVSNESIQQCRFQSSLNSNAGPAHGSFAWNNDTVSDLFPSWIDRSKPTLTVKFNSRADEMHLHTTVLGVLRGSPGVFVAVGTLKINSAGEEQLVIVPESLVSCKMTWDITMIPSYLEYPATPQQRPSSDPAEPQF